MKCCLERDRKSSLFPRGTGTGLHALRTPQERWKEVDFSPSGKSPGLTAGGERAQQGLYTCLCRREGRGILIQGLGHFRDRE